jgi:type VI secretion system secreted protein VgrG
MIRQDESYTLSKLTRQRTYILEHMDPALLAKRNIFITTSVPNAPLVFEAMSGQEMLGRPFNYQVDLLSDSHDVDLQALLGQRITIHVEGERGERFFNGIITEFRWVGVTTRFYRYRATLQPEVSLLAYRADSRIFQAMSVKDIVLRVLRAGNVTVDGSVLRGNYSPLEYVVQYRESDLNFVSRLMEGAGIYYDFKHEADKHTMVLLDDTDQCTPAPGYETVPYLDATGGEGSNEERFFAWSQGARIVPGQFTIRGYRYDTRARTPTALAKTSIQNANGSPRAGGESEVYDFPVLPLSEDAARAEALLRLEEHEAWLATTQAEGDTRGIGIGHILTVQGLIRTGLDRTKFLVVRAGYALTVQPYEGNALDASQREFHASYTLIDARQGYRTPCDTLKPRVAGPQTATVVGHKNQAADDEICTDEQDRVLVKFNWDRRGEPNGPADEDADKDKDQSCFVRVSQLWAGSGWGAMYLPRIGHEVIVEFLEGDPDRPIITGRVYNATNPPPYPQKPTQSGIKSRSTKGAGSNNFNEIRFEDKKGSEELFVQAEKDHTTNVKNNQSTSVGADRTLGVGGNDSTTVGGNRTRKVTGNDSTTIGQNQTLSVTGNRTKTVTGNESVTIAASSTETVANVRAVTIGAAYQVTVGGAMNETVGAAKIEEVGAAKSVAVAGISSEKVGASKSIEAGANVDLAAGKVVAISAGTDLAAQASKNLTVEAGDQLTLKCGDATIVLKKSGDITINGKKIDVKASGDLVMKGSKITGN